MATTSRSTRSTAKEITMNSIDWLKSVRKNTQKPLIPPDPPEATPGENAVKTLIPPVAPGSSVYLFKNEIISEEGVKGKICTTEGKVETSGGHRGNIGFYRGNDDLDHRGHRGNQGNMNVSEIQPAPAALPKPFFTPGGDLSIPFGSDPKYHWWNGGQSVEQTRADVRSWMAAEVDNQVA